MKENWKYIPGYEGIYKVSDQGRVRSVDRLVRQGASSNPDAKRLMRGRILKQQTNCKNKYQYVALSSFGEPIDFSVHSLVALAFLGPRPAGKEVAHNDGDRSNSALSNLRYATTKENADDRVSHGTQKYGEEHHKYKHGRYCQ